MDFLELSLINFQETDRKVCTKIGIIWCKFTDADFHADVFRFADNFHCKSATYERTLGKPCQRGWKSAEVLDNRHPHVIHDQSDDNFDGNSPLKGNS